jgi:flagellar biosynthesis activator protein FlaF
MSVRRYQKTQDAAEDPRSIERFALTRVNGMLSAGAESGGRTLTEACHKNWQLWSIFQSDLADPGNPLPDTLKAQLISLSIWVQKYTPQVLFQGASVEPLINVNRSIMEGLAPAPAGAPRTSPAELQPVSA